MIRNIVFDMGMVLLEYDPVKVCWEYTDNPEDVEWMRRELFDSKKDLLISSQSDGPEKKPMEMTAFH